MRATLFLLAMAAFGYVGQAKAEVYYYYYQQPSYVYLYPSYPQPIYSYPSYSLPTYPQPFYEEREVYYSRQTRWYLQPRHRIADPIIRIPAYGPQ